MKKKKQEQKGTYKDTNKILLILKGSLMGLFDLVPGISGGTMALITGIYKELIQEINNFFKLVQAIILLNKNKIKKTWRELNKEFLILLVLGIIIGIIISVIALNYLLNNYFTQTLGTITGIILIASTSLIRQNVKETKTVLIGIIGIILGVVLSVITPNAGHEFSYAQTFFLGTITITAMILPGISGALILLLLGGYEFMIDALRNIKTNYDTVLSFLLGAVVGLGVFSRTINHLLQKYHNETMAFLSCLMLGATTKPIIEILINENPEKSIIFIILGMIITFFFFRKK